MAAVSSGPAAAAQPQVEPALALPRSRGTRPECPPALQLYKYSDCSTSWKHGAQNTSRTGEIKPGEGEKGGKPRSCVGSEGAVMIPAPHPHRPDPPSLILHPNLPFLLLIFHLKQSPGLLGSPDSQGLTGTHALLPLS